MQLRAPRTERLNQNHYQLSEKREYEKHLYTSFLSACVCVCVCVYRKEGRLVLSFGDELEEEEGTEFKVKKTGLSRKAAKMAERERKGRRKRDM